VDRKTNNPIIGLLGGVGSGKSSVARILESLGATVVDADRITGECLDDPKVRQKIESSFGKQVIGDSGSVNRKVLADLVFTDERNRQELHTIIHPEIRERMREQIDRVRSLDRSVWIVIDAPLLFESPFKAECDLLIMVQVPLETRVERVKAERGWSGEELERRESTQTSLEEKARAAHVVVDNSGSLEDLEKRVEELFIRLNKRS